MIVSNPAAIKLSPKFPKFQDLRKFQKQLLFPGVRDLVSVWIWGLHYLWILWQSHNKGKQWISHQKIVHTMRSSSLFMCGIHHWQWWTPHMHNLLMTNFMKLWYCLTLGWYENIPSSKHASSNSAQWVQRLPAPSLHLWAECARKNPTSRLGVACLHRSWHAGNPNSGGVAQKEFPRDLNTLQEFGGWESVSQLVRHIPKRLNFLRAENSSLQPGIWEQHASRGISTNVTSNLSYYFCNLLISPMAICCERESERAIWQCVIQWLVHNVNEKLLKVIHLSTWTISI